MNSDLLYCTAQYFSPHLNEQHKLEIPRKMYEANEPRGNHLKGTICVNYESYREFMEEVIRYKQEENDSAVPNSGETRG